ncbi:MAG: hypothetical protein HYV41_03655 [Candidatus Magasanikbacteria bacterium]|nr:hypothetical protein [Candidatus Magasanikbacteria bacterium]
MAHKETKSFVVYQGGESVRDGKPPLAYKRIAKGRLTSRPLSHEEVEEYALHSHEKPFEQDFEQVNTAIEVVKNKTILIIKEIKSFVEYYTELREETVHFFGDLKHIEGMLFPLSMGPVCIYDTHGTNRHSIQVTKRDLRQHTRNWIRGYQKAIHNFFLQKFDNLTIGRKVVIWIQTDLKTKIFRMKQNFDKMDVVPTSLNNKFIELKICVEKINKLLDRIKIIDENLAIQMIALKYSIFNFDLKQLPEVCIDLEQLQAMEEEIRTICQS